MRTCLVTSVRTSGILFAFIVFPFWAAHAAPAEQLKSARVTQVIKEVNLLPSQAAARPAAVSDEVQQGTAVRTGVESRAELTFTDATITRLGQNTVFSFNEGTRDVSLGKGAILVQVPPKASAVKINSAAFTCAVTGGTALLESNAGHPNKVMILEGNGELCSTKNPNECQTILPGEMVIMTADGHVTKPVKFNAALVFKSSHLITDFPALPNEPLILETIEQQQTDQNNGPPAPPPNDPTDTIDQKEAATTSGSSPPPNDNGKFGPLNTITSPDPYVIGSGTTIQTDPTITTNGVTDSGRLYRDIAQDGTAPEYLYGSTTTLDALVFDEDNEGGPVAVFKFSSLQLTGDPIIITDNGGATKLALVSVGDITSNGSESTLSFAGLDDVFIGTQSGSIHLGPDISFAGFQHLSLYARGNGADLILGSSISDMNELHLDAEDTVQINSSVEVQQFRSRTGGAFLDGDGHVTSPDIRIESLGDIHFTARHFSSGAEVGGSSLELFADHDIHIDITGDQSIFSQASFVDVQAGNTLSMGGEVDVRPNGPLEGFPEPVTLHLDATNGDVSFSAGAGGIQAYEVAFSTTGPLHLESEGDINVWEVEIPSNEGGGRTIEGDIHAGGHVNAFGNISTGSLTAGTSISVFGDVTTAVTTAGTTIYVGGQLNSSYVGAGGDVTASGVTVVNLNTPTGLLNVTGSAGIKPLVFVSDSEPDGAAAPHTFNVFSINAQSGGIDFSGNQFGGINNDLSGGILTINADNLTFDTGVAGNAIGYANFNGADGFGFDWSPLSGQGGNGGTFVVNALNDITVNAPITAATGLNDGSKEGAEFGGAGGHVTLHSDAGTISVSDLIQVASNEASMGSGEPFRASASGGIIDITSDKESGLAVNITTLARLLSLLNPNAPGPGGSISITTAGGSIHIGQDFADEALLQADRGTISLEILNNPGIEGSAEIVIDCAQFIAETVNMHSAGDIIMGGSDPAPIHAPTISLTADQDVTWGSGASSTEVVAHSSGDVTIAANNNINLPNGLTIVRTNTNRASGLNLTVDAGNELQGGGEMLLQTDASGQTAGSLKNGANIIVHGGLADIGTLSATVLALDSNLTTGANITVSSEEDFSTSLGFLRAAAEDPAGMILTVDNTGGQISDGGNITVDVGGSLTTQDLDLQIHNGEGHFLTGDADGNANISVTTGTDLTADTIYASINNNAGVIDRGGNITFDVGDELLTTGDANFTLFNDVEEEGRPSAGTSLSRTLDVGAATIDVGGNLTAYDTALVTDAVTVHASDSITVTGKLAVLGTVTATNNITAGTLASLNVIADTVDVQDGGITRFSAVNQTIVERPYVITANHLTSSGGIHFGGIAADGDFSPATDGGDLTINVNSVTFGEPDEEARPNAGILPEGVDIVGPINFNGGNASSTFAAGYGGTFTVNATGDITVDTAIEATTGFQPEAAAPSGAGGTVNLNTTGGTVTVSNRIEVSSAPDVEASTVRRSNSGGNINITSGKESGTAIQISSSAQLLALLDSSATGAGGKITITATGPTAGVNTSGTIRADIVKIGALGSNGTLSIGGGEISADTLLKLYAGGSDGSIIFTESVTLNGNSVKIIAANTVTINDNKVVTIGGPLAASVYTNNANYASLDAFENPTGGNNTTTGQFAGAGVTTSNFVDAPGFGVANRPTTRTRQPRSH